MLCFQECSRQVNIATGTASCTIPNVINVFQIFSCWLIASFLGPRRESYASAHLTISPSPQLSNDEAAWCQVSVVPRAHFPFLFRGASFVLDSERHKGMFCANVMSAHSDIELKYQKLCRKSSFASFKRNGQLCSDSSPLCSDQLPIPSRLMSYENLSLALRHD